MSDNLKVLYAEYIEDVWNNRNLANTGKYIDENIVSHSMPPGLDPGLEGINQLFGMIQGAFPDWRVEIQFQVQEGDLLVTRDTTSGTQQGTFHGIPATGKKFTSTQTHILRYKDGKQVEHWSNADDLGMMMQLGVIPAPQGA